MIPRLKAAVQRWRREPILPAALRRMAEGIIAGKAFQAAAVYVAVGVALTFAPATWSWIWGGLYFGFIAGVYGGRSAGAIAGAERVRQEVRLVMAQRQEADAERAAKEAEIERQARLN